jgi:hypothetical protein
MHGITSASSTTAVLCFFPVVLLHLGTIAVLILCSFLKSMIGLLGLECCGDTCPVAQCMLRCAMLQHAAVTHVAAMVAAVHISCS